MEQGDVERFRDNLKRILAGFGQTRDRRDELAIENSADTLDEVGNAAGRELAAHQLELDAKRLAEATAALRRIEEGTFGICLECDSEIGMKRLNAVPWARYCIRCQELADRGSNGVAAISRPDAVMRKFSSMYAE